MPASSRRSLAIRELIRRRSISILVSPGPRPPMPRPPAARPPTWRDSDSPQPRRRGSRYCIWASSTCALPSFERACWAKMSRIRAVRSTTLTFVTRFELAQLARRQLAVADDGVGADGQHDVAQLLGLARADVGGRVGAVAALDQRVEHLRARGLGQPGELDQRVLGLGQRAGRPHPDQHDALEAQLAVLDLGDVLEFGRQPGHPAQRLPVLEFRADLLVRSCSVHRDTRAATG